MINEEKLFGIYIDKYKITDRSIKRLVSNHLYGWKPKEMTLKEWIKQIIDEGYSCVIGDRITTDENKYTHDQATWRGTNVIALDIDEFAHTDDEGVEHEGAPPFTGSVNEWKELNPGLIQDLYALGQSVSTMVKGKTPHRRFRGFVLMERKITDWEEYKDIISGFASKFPMIPRSRRGASQPIHGFAGQQLDLIKDEIRSTGAQVKTHIMGNVLNEEQIDNYIKAGREMEEKIKQEKQKKKKEQRIVKRNPNLKVKERTHTVSDFPEKTFDIIAKDVEFAKAFMTECGSTFVGESSVGYEFDRAGDGSPNGEVLLLAADGTLIFRARSDNSWFVKSGHCDHEQSVRFSDLFRNIKYPGLEWIQQLAALNEEYPDLDNGWRPEIKPFKEMKPWNALNYDVESAVRYIIETEGVEAITDRGLKQLEPGYDDQLYLQWTNEDEVDCFTLFSDYVAYINDVEDLVEIASNEEWHTAKAKEAWRDLNNIAEQIVGSTGGWNQKRKRQKKVTRWRK